MSVNKEKSGRLAPVCGVAEGAFFTIIASEPSTNLPDERD